MEFVDDFFEVLAVDQYVKCVLLTIGDDVVLFETLYLLNQLLPWTRKFNDEYLDCSHLDRFSKDRGLTLP